LTRGSFYGLKGQVLEKAVQRAAEEAEVTEFLNRPYGQLSGGSGAGQIWPGTCE